MITVRGLTRPAKLYIMGSRSPHSWLNTCNAKDHNTRRTTYNRSIPHGGYVTAGRNTVISHSTLHAVYGTKMIAV